MFAGLTDLLGDHGVEVFTCELWIFLHEPLAGLEPAAR